MLIRKSFCFRSVDSGDLVSQLVMLILYSSIVLYGSENSSLKNPPSTVLSVFYGAVKTTMTVEFKIVYS